MAPEFYLCLNFQLTAERRVASLVELLICGSRMRILPSSMKVSAAPQGDYIPVPQKATHVAWKSVFEAPRSLVNLVDPTISSSMRWSPRIEGMRFDVDLHHF